MEIYIGKSSENVLASAMPGEGRARLKEVVKCALNSESTPPWTP